MKRIKQILAVIIAVLTVFACSVPAFAEVDREAIINAWFKYTYEAGHTRSIYKNDVGIEVPVSENPFAAVDYEWIKQSVALIDDDDLKKVYTDTESSLRWLNDTFGGVYDYHGGIERGMTLLWDYGVEGYEDGVWLTAESGNDLLNDEKYRRVVFIDNGDSFTLQTEDGTEQLGTYKKVYGFDTDEDIGYSGDLEEYFSGSAGAGGSGGSGGSAASTSQTTSTSSDEYNTSTVRAADNADKSASSRTTTTTTKTTTTTSGSQSIVSGNNAPVTPEVVSAVDAAKAAQENENDTDTENELNTHVTVGVAEKRTPKWIYFAVIIAVGVGAYFLGKKRNQQVK